MAHTTLHLLRHGEVHNPRGIVYGSLPGYGLSERGRAQADAAATHLADRRVRAIYSSPLGRARETAEVVAAKLGTGVVLDDRLGEWALGERWADVRWDDLSDRFPGETEAYLAHPHELPFAPEPLHAVAARMQQAIADLSATTGNVVMVSHQDPIQAVRLLLTGVPLSRLQNGKPGHGSVVTLLREGSQWRETGYWAPPQGPAFPPIAREA